MPTFDTPEPVTATLDVAAGNIQITATDRTDTVVEVRPSDPSREQDVRAAGQTRVEFAESRLLVRGPRQRNLPFGRPGSVDVTIELPTGSHLRARATAMARFCCTGRLGDCRIRTNGDIQLDDAGPVNLRTGAGSIDVGTVTGEADASTGTGRIRLGEITGAGTLHTGNGDLWIGRIGGNLRAKSANGAITVDHAGADVSATSSNGALRVGELARGSTWLKTACGQVEIGVRSGTAARLDVSTRFGQVRNQMEATDQPGPSEHTAQVRARTGFGDIVIRRAEPLPA